MKGGITSGVVYPGAVLDLAGKYRFESVGGASAGAIAAVVTAAAEYGARTDGPGGFQALEDVVKDLSRDGFLEGLFQATPAAQPLLRAVLAGLREKRSPLGRALDVARALLGPARWLIVAVAIAGVALLAGAIALARGLPLLVAALALPLLALVVVGATAFVAYRLARKAASRLNAELLDHGFGLCPGTQQRGYDGDALTEWLHGRIQAAAGLPDDEPLTFEMLAGAGIRLEVMTTDLSYARPQRLPFDEESEYFFRTRDLAKLFPAPVVAVMSGDQPPDAPGSAVLPVPTAGLPVLVAARMSLSFPILLSAVRLYTLHPDYSERVETGQDPMIENWFSDGGIASNFPIHFFDSWLPSHPTFGLDLQPAGMRPDAAAVELVGRVDRLAPPRWAHVRSLGVFAAQIRDVMQNWRDNLQAGLPGYRDRICAVRLQPEEGGLNLNMTGETIKRLVDRGRCAGETVRTEFDWPAHRWSRYLTLMQMLEVNLRDTAGRFGPLAEQLSSGRPGTDAFARGHEEAWCRAAGEATAALVEVAREWGTADPPALGFNRGGGVEPLPTPVMRITPRV